MNIVLKKLTVLAVIAFLPVLKLKSQSHQYERFSEIRLYWNTDSIEKSLHNSSNKSIDYINTLISLERSRDVLNSAYFGKHIDQIEKYAVKHENPFLIAFLSYLKIRRHTMFRQGDYNTTFDAANKSLKIFKETSDTTGMLNVYCQKAFLEMFLQQSISNNSVNRGEYNLHDINSSQKLMDSANTLILENVDNQITYFSTWQKIIFGTTKNADLLRFFLFKTHNFFEKSNGNILYKAPALSSSFLFIGNLYIYIIDNGNNQIGDSALYFFNQGLKIKRNSESFYEANFYGGISNFYAKHNNFRKCLDYANLCQKLLDSLNVNNEYQYLIPYNNKVIAYKGLNDAKNYTLYLDKLFLLREKISTRDHSATYSINQYQQSIINKEHENKMIEAKLSQNKKILILGSLVLILLLLFLISIIKNRNTLKRRNNTIQSLLQSREKFYSILAHDIRSPMKSYQGMASKISFLLKKGMYDEINEMSHKIDITGIRLDGLFQNLINWSKLQQNNLNIVLQTVHPHQVINEILQIHETIIDEKNIKVIFESDETIKLQIDSNYFSIIIRNLIDNAIKNVENQKLIQISSKNEDKKYVFTISNSSEINLNNVKIIQQFFDSKQFIHPGEQGMGLGLILIKEFTQKMGGSISVEKQGNKIQFHVSLNQ